MPGVSWSHRQPTDWLASNGLWYPSSSYPHGWSTSALPPAPGHGGIGSILRLFVEKEPIESGASAPSPPSSSTVGSASKSSTVGRPSSSGPASASQPPSSSVVPTGRGVADATVTEVPTKRPDSRSLAEAPGPRPALNGGNAPPPPGRLSPTNAPSAPPTTPAPPVTSASPTTPPSPTPPSPHSALTEPFEVIAGDFGRVLGSAKGRIAQAINESAKS
jgi:hypothetical protein